MLFFIFLFKDFWKKYQVKNLKKYIYMKQPIS